MEVSSANDQKHEDDPKWRVCVFLMVLAVVAAFAIVPFLLEVTRALGNNTPSWQLVPGIIFERVFYSCIAICVGLILAPKVGLRAPLMNAATPEEPRLAQRLGSLLVPSITCAVGVSALIYFIDPVVESALMPPWPEGALRAKEVAEHMSPWKPLLASFAAGVSEELWFRFCAMTLFAWLGCRLTRRPAPGAAVLWIANLLAALLFGLVHLTNVLQLEIPITPGLVLYVVLWNGLAGLVFGWLYWRRGLFAAIVAHTVVDIILKVVVPMIDTAFT
jgi:membrane protease YdiL (CAAX protease family)